MAITWSGGLFMKEVVIVSAVRTAVGKYGGSLQNVSPVDLAALVISEGVRRAGIEAGQIDEVIMGNVLQGGLGQNVARQASVRAGVPQEVPAWTINIVCGSGLKSVSQAAGLIANNEADIVIAGGTENMSAAPYLVESARWGYRMGDGNLKDLMIRDGLWCAFGNYHMGITAENVAERYGISREEQDAFAAESQQKAIAAIDNGRFKDEIVPVPIPQKKGQPLEFDTDEFPRRGTTAESLAKLPPAFKKGGTVTAGNASGINDGAAAIVLMASDKAQELNIKPLFLIRSSAVAGVDPAIMGTGPISASRKALARASLTIADMDLIEANEAFASQAISVMRQLELPAEKTNVKGGAIAIGHPIGASGARILVTLLHEMKHRGSKYGLATLCIGGGMGAAMVVENI